MKRNEIQYTVKDSDYNDAINWLFSRLPMFSRIGAPAYKPGLETTERLDALYGHPHRNFKTIHVAGTNGKGSTSHMIAAVLQANGYKTGLYTSPHLIDFRERMRIDGTMIPKANVVEFVNNWKEKIYSQDIDTIGLNPSFFELTMMMAFDWFARENVDYAVIEVGMGGRLDSTNVITPLLSIITNISFDHTQFLGNTLEDIAREKAGIIKPGIPVIIGEAAGNVKDIFSRKAVLEGSEILFAEDCIVEESIDLPLKGNYQKKNLRTVMGAMGIMKKIGISLNDNKIKQGLENVTSLTGLRGRWEIVSEDPTVVCDTGHNVAGLSETMKTLHERYGGKKLRFVIGFVNDKDVSHIVKLFPLDAEYYFSQAKIPRAMPAEEVAAHFALTGISGKIFKTVKEAFINAMKDSSVDDVIYIGGSTFIVADFLQDMEQNKTYD